MKKYFILIPLAIAVIACEPENPTPNTPDPTPNNPADTTGTPDTTGTGGDTTTSVAYALFEMFKPTSDGINLRNTVDSIRFRNLETGYTKKWTASQIEWVNKNGNFYGSNYGNYVKSFVQRPNGGDSIFYAVYFNQPDNRLIKMSYDDLPGGAGWDLPISGATGLEFISIDTY